MEKRGTVLMNKYELGKMLGQGTFAKVYHARHLSTGQSIALKIIDKDRVLKAGLIDQIKREISIMRLVKHPNVVQLHEVMATKTKIYLALEHVKGGELFNKVAKGRLKEASARKYFHQLIAAVDFCHSRGVYHRDLKPENLLLDEFGNLKVSDFGLSAFHESKRQDGLLHTTCGTPAYVAPEVLLKKGYDGEKADIWSCGVILYVLLTGYLPFHDSNLMVMYRKISRADYKCPRWFSSDVKRLLSKLLDPNPATRMTIDKLRENPWFMKEMKIEIPEAKVEDDHVPNANNSSPRSVLDNYPEIDLEGNSDDDTCEPDQKATYSSVKPTTLNAFEIINSLSRGFNLSGLFENNVVGAHRFTTQKPASVVMSKLEEVAMTESFNVKKTQDGKVKLQGCKQGRKGQLAIDAEIFEVAPSFHLVEMTKTSGDTLEYCKFCNQDLRPSLKDIVWTWQSDKHQVQE
ncbi:CBL-interacting protein kinase 5-like [Apium graveolens]|uniref:CBL-interacting protein kinase 5-like n=1 Tax=Apium graveolens TaxID=4045 RepID=UPI003D7BC8A3